MYSINEGYVIYKRGANHVPGSPWRNIYEKNIREANKLQHLYQGMTKSQKVEQVSSNLIALGERERKNELELLRAAGIELPSDMDIKDFVKNFNEVLMGQKQFGAAVQRLKSALDSASKKKEFRAPTIASWFTSYLGTELSKRLNRLMDDNRSDFLQEDFSKWDEKIDDIIDRSINAALKKMLTEVESKEGKELYGDKSQWSEVYESLMALEGMQKDFKEMLYSKINFANLRKLLARKDIISGKGKRRGTRKFIDSDEVLNFKNGKKSRSIGGSVQEFLNALIANLDTSVKVTDKGSKVLSSEIAKTDSIAFFSFDTELDATGLAEAIVEDLNDDLLNSTNLKATADTMERFYNERLSKLNNSFIVYSSTKSYTLSDSFKRFSAGSPRKIEDIKYILENNNQSLSNIEDYLKVIYNTGEGAIFDDKQSEVEENLKIALMGAISNILFDDWTTIGMDNTTGTKAIHVLALEGIQLPLSVLLIATGHAMQDVSNKPERYVNVSLKLPGPIMFPTPQPALATDKDTKEQVLKNWDEQRSKVHQNTTFVVHFLANFKTEILKYIDF